MPIEYQMLATLTVAAFVLLGYALYLRRQYNDRPEEHATEPATSRLQVVFESTDVAANHLADDPLVMPPDDHQLVQGLRQELAKDGLQLNDSEVLRAGLHALASLSAQAREEVVEAIQRQKPQRQKP